MPREGGKSGADQASTPHRGFGFIIFSSTESAEDAIDNMHLNEWGGKILNVNFARPMGTTFNSNKPVWQDEVRIIFCGWAQALDRAWTDTEGCYTGMDRQVRIESDTARRCT